MIVLKRTDAEDNTDRWYAVTVQPTLLHEYAVTYFWGRGDTSYQKVQTIPTDSREEAHKLAEKKVAEKIRRGYKQVNEGS